MYHSSLNRRSEQKAAGEDKNGTLLTNLEVAFRFLSTLSTSHASTFKWQVINVNLKADSETDLKKIRQSFKELMEL